MRPIRNIEEAIKGEFRVAASPALHDRVLTRVRYAQKQWETTPALHEPAIGRTIMRNPITRFAVAAVIVAAVVLGVCEFLSTGGASGVAWARVAQKVRDMDTYTFRERRILTAGPRPEGFAFTMDVESIYHCSKEHGVYVQGYRDGQPFMAFYALPQRRERVTVDLSSKRYEHIPLTNADLAEIRDLQPQAIVPRVLSRDHAEIGQDTIDGVSVLGVQTHDPTAAFLETAAVEDFTARLWIDGQTDLPVWVEISYVRKDSKMRTILVYDRFRWNEDLAPSLFEPNIPADFTPRADLASAGSRSSWALALDAYAASGAYLSDFDHLPRPNVDHLVLLGVDPNPRPTAALPQDMQQIWRTQDECLRTWPRYAEVRDRLYPELVDAFHIDQLSIERLMATGIAFRERFWTLGGALSEVSYPYAYAARLVCEVAHERELQNLAVTDQLVESILTTERVWNYDPNSGKPSRNPVYGDILLDLRTRQFEQIQARVSAGAVPTVKDLIRVSDLTALLGYARDFDAGMQVFDWMIQQAAWAGWTVYERRFRAGRERFSEGKPYAFPIFVGGFAFPEEYRYGRRLDSFQGPVARRLKLLPIHLADPRDVSSSGD